MALQRVEFRMPGLAVARLEEWRVQELIPDWRGFSSLKRPAQALHPSGMVRLVRAPVAAFGRRPRLTPNGV